MWWWYKTIGPNYHSARIWEHTNHKSRYVASHLATWCKWMLTHIICLFLRDISNSIRNGFEYFKTFGGWWSMKLINTGKYTIPCLSSWLLYDCTYCINSGAFGAHVACLLRRLIRVCLYHGCIPQFILCSATIANPVEHINRLVPLHLFGGDNLEVITNQDDGAPHGER